MCTVKLIYVNPLSRLSLQYHKKRSEFWMVVTGIAHVQVDNRFYVLKEGQTIEIPKNTRHRMRNSRNILRHVR